MEMKCKAMSGKMVLRNDHYVGEAYDCTDLTSLATDGILPAGTILPSNDASALGVLLTDVDLNANPNGTIVTHGYIWKSKLPVEPTEAALTALQSRGVIVE